MRFLSDVSHDFHMHDTDHFKNILNTESKFKKNTLSLGYMFLTSLFFQVFICKKKSELVEVVVAGVLLSAALLVLVIKMW